MDCDLTPKRVVMHCDLTPKRVVMDCDLTPKAFANFSPGLERSDNPGFKIKIYQNPERVRWASNPFRV